GLTRLALSDEDKRGRDLMVRWMREAGLRVSVDQMGNIFGERAGSEPLPPVMMGSHVDSVPTGGKYDGQLGVLCGLETIRARDSRSTACRTTRGRRRCAFATTAWWPPPRSGPARARSRRSSAAIS